MGVSFLAAYAIAFALSNDKLPWVEVVRSRIPALDRLLSCMFCTGFHAGWVVWLIKGVPDVWAGYSWDLRTVSDLTLFALASATFCYCVDAAVSWFERSLSPEV